MPIMPVKKLTRYLPAVRLQSNICYLAVALCSLYHRNSAKKLKIYQSEQSEGLMTFIGRLKLADMATTCLRGYLKV